MIIKVRGNYTSLATVNFTNTSNVSAVGNYSIDGFNFGNLTVHYGGNGSQGGNCSAFGVANATGGQGGNGTSDGYGAGGGSGAACAYNTGDSSNHVAKGSAGASGGPHSNTGAVGVTHTNSGCGDIGNITGNPGNPNSTGASGALAWFATGGNCNWGDVGTTGQGGNWTGGNATISSLVKGNGVTSIMWAVAGSASAGGAPGILTPHLYVTANRYDFEGAASTSSTAAQNAGTPSCSVTLNSGDAGSGGGGGGGGGADAGNITVVYHKLIANNGTYTETAGAFGLGGNNTACPLTGQNGQAGSNGTANTYPVASVPGNLVVTYGTGCTATGSNSTFIPPANVTINATALTGYGFSNWSVTAGNATVSNTTNANTQIQVFDDTPATVSANCIKVITVSLVAPANGTNTTNNSITFSFNTSTNYASTLCNLTIDGALNATNIFAPNNTQVNTTVSPFYPTASHTWNITCWNGTNTGSSPTYAFNVNASLTANQVAPADGYALNVSAATVNITITGNCTGNSPSYFANLTINGAVNVSNIYAANNTNFSNTILFAVPSNDTWLITCWNGSTSNTSGTRSFNLTIIYGNLTVNATVGGTATGNNSTFLPPANLTINATANAGYAFANWSITTGNCSVLNASNPNTKVQVLNYSWCNAQASFTHLPINVTVALPSGISNISLKCFQPYMNDTQPDGQDIYTPIMNITNIGSFNITNITIALNQSLPSGFSIYGCAANYRNPGCALLNTTGQTIIRSGILQGKSKGIWFFGLCVNVTDSQSFSFNYTVGGV